MGVRQRMFLSDVEKKPKQIGFEGNNSDCVWFIEFVCSAMKSFF
jgi:hypothetical protein